MSHLLALLEEEDSAYISVDDLISEVHELIGFEHNKIKAIEIILMILRKERLDFDVYIKRDNGWDRDYSCLKQLMRNEKKLVEDFDNDLPF